MKLTEKAQKLTYKVGYVNPSDKKFIVGMKNEDEAIIYFCTGNKFHSRIAKKHDVRALGGGNQQFMENGKRYGSYSTDYGPVPKPILKKFQKGLLLKLQEKDNQIKEIQFNPGFLEKLEFDSWGELVDIGEEFKKFYDNWIKDSKFRNHPSLKKKEKEAWRCFMKEYS